VREKVIELLERALSAARSNGDLAEVGVLAAQASSSAGTPQTLVELAREMRTKGLRTEADLIMLSIDVAVAAATHQAEVYETSLISVHNIACDRLDDLEQRKTPATEPPRATRLN
jgi:hypothetical protein